MNNPFPHTPGRWMATAALILALLIGLMPPDVSQAAGGVVTDCSNASDLSAKLVSGGTVTFDCGPDPVTIVLTAPFIVLDDTLVDGGGKVTLSGGGATRHFEVRGNTSLTLQNLTLTQGYWENDDGGSVRNDGALAVHNVRFVDNQAGPLHIGGAIVSFGPLTITGSEFVGNSADHAGAVFAGMNTAVTQIKDSTFDGNQARHDLYGIGGAMWAWFDAMVTIENSTFNANTAGSEGGAIASTAGSSLTITGGELTNNRVTSSSGTGGAIFSDGSLEASGVTLRGNSAGLLGGGVYIVKDTASLAQSTLADNAAPHGSGIYNAAGSLTLMDVTFDHNGYDDDAVRVAVTGGALDLRGGATTLEGVTLSNNAAAIGAGAYLSSGTVSLTNATLSGNAADACGGIDAEAGSLTLIHVTLNENAAAGTASGVCAFGAAAIEAYNTIIAGGQGAPNCVGAFAAQGFNLSSDASCGFGVGRDGVAVKLGPLADNGGSTRTHAPLAGSPTIDAAGAARCPGFDQRGVQRPYGNACDVGAVEFTPSPIYLPLIRK